MGRLVVWYVVFAAYAGAVAVFSGAGEDRSWGIWAAAAYAAAALLTVCWRSHGRAAALLASVAGALVIPLAWLATHEPPTPDVRVVSRSAALALRNGTPYLSAAHLEHAHGAIAYNPYLPAMAVFGLPRAMGTAGVAGDPRLWLGAASLLLFILAFHVAGRRDALRCGLFAVASPVVAFPLALGITDPPVLALLCVALAFLSQSSRTIRVWPAAIALGVACAMKATAWPAVPVFAAMLVARDGARAAVRFTAAAVVTTVVLVVASAPAAFSRPAALIQNTVLFPLGLTRVKTPAESPLPGHLLAMMGPAGRAAALGLLIVAGLAVAFSLVARPPADGPAAARRLALGLTLMFALSPATRLGYFAYPLGLYGWLALTDSRARIRLQLSPAPVTAPAAAPAGAVVPAAPGPAGSSSAASAATSPDSRTAAAPTGAAWPGRLAAPLKSARSFRFGGLLERGERHRDAQVRSLGAIGNVGVGVGAEPLLEHGDSVGEELP